MARLPLLSLLLMGPPFGRGGADATGDRRGAVRARGRASPAGVLLAETATGDRRQGDTAQSWRRREEAKAGGMECGPYWPELPHWVEARAATQ